ncbi:MAG: FAD:protein FMN transferase [bacterium]
MRAKQGNLPALLFVFCVLFLSCSKFSPRHVKHNYFRIDTFTEITIVQTKQMDMEPVWNGIDLLLLDWEERFSPGNEKSELLAMNKRHSNCVPVSPKLGEIICTGLMYGDSLDGMFDITILPIKELWGLGEKGGAQRVPPKDSISLILKKVDYRKVKVNKFHDSLFFDSPDIKIDVGGIAKGFVLDEIGHYLDKFGFQNFLIVAGGDILCKGGRCDGRAWRIGIQHPRHPGQLLGLVDLDSGSIVTSGDYQRFWMKDGIRYHHIFNPRTGISCAKNQSLTLWGMDPIEIDILSTGLFGLSADSIISFINIRPRLEGVVVDSSGNKMASNGWAEKIQWN